MKTDYKAQYYSRLSRGSRASAAAVVPLVLDAIRPSSVVDIGCGTGAWLAEFKRHGINDVLGVDGPHIPSGHLDIEPSEFLATDLSQPLQLERMFDLAVSLEVAEHLEPAQADQFIESLTQLAPAILFSAAVPFQGGEHHVNEQWPTYWAERFEAHDFAALDVLRSSLWDRSEVEWWYAQNVLLFVRHDAIANYPRLTNLVPSAPTSIPSFVHPRNYLHHTWQNRVLRVAVDIATTTRPGDIVVLADDDRFGELYLPGRSVRPFVERDGIYFGPPGDDAEGIEELERMKAEGASYFAIGWPAFWWLDYYKQFARYLEMHHFSVLRNERILMYRLDVAYEPTPIDG